MFSRLLIPPQDKSFFLLGPRGTGKTTWVRSMFPKAIYIDLLEAELFNDLLANPQRLENFIPKNFKDWIVIDEVQKIPELLNEVHRLIEKHKFKFILTGSSARKIRRKGVNLLAGRALALTFHPLTTLELDDYFDLDHSLKYGQMPSVYVENNPKAYLESYVKTYLNEEIREEGLTRSLANFSRFLEAASFSQGSVLNITEVARECSIERKVVENYFLILEDLLIASRLPVFSKKAKRRLITHPKFYFFDVGVYRTLRPHGPLDTPEKIEGVALETLILQELIATNSLLGLGYTLYYWRTSNQQEVDFVLYGDKGLIAIEVKRSSRTPKDYFSGLKAFLRDYPMAKLYLVYGGNRWMREDEIEIIPIRDFLKQIKLILNPTP